jgi:AcrR family transcriptional regulator
MMRASSSESRRAGQAPTGRRAGRDVRELLVASAAEVFARDGFHASRVSDIVRGAGVAQGTFYLYFETKQAVFVELVERFFERVLAETLSAHDPCAANTHEQVVAQVRRMWRTLLVRCRQEPAMVTAILQDAPSLGPDVRALVLRCYQRGAEALTRYAVVAAERGLIRPIDPGLVGWLVQGLAERAMYYAVVIDPHADVDWLADQLTMAECGGVLTRWDEASLQRATNEDLVDRERKSRTSKGIER